MTFERSHGKARPTLPRASDLRPVESVEKPTTGRAAHGHFAAGNRSGVGARFVHTVKKSLGKGVSSAETHVIARDARRVFAHVLRSMPSQAPAVRVLVAMHARHVALHGYYTAKAEEAGLTTPAGLNLLQVADRQSQRAERLLVSAQDMARVCAQSENVSAHDPLAAWRAPEGDKG